MMMEAAGLPEMSVHM